MPRHIVMLALIVALATTVARAEGNAPTKSDDCCPTDAKTQPAASAAQPAMPKGHPDIAGMQQKLPKGHPVTGGQELPQGHPSMDLAAQGNVVGTLTIQAVQGTKAGPDIGADKAVIDLYRDRKRFKQITTQLDARGLATIGDLPVGGGIQPVVTIVHRDVAYRVVGQPLTPAKPAGEVEVKVYETTEQMPEWKVAMRQLMLNRQPRGYIVKDVLLLRNPADRTWLGHKVDVTDHQQDQDQAHDKAHGDAEPAEARQTIVLTLPENATDVKLGNGFDVCCTQIKGNNVIVTKPLRAGDTRLSLTYRVPAVDEQVRIAIAAPSATDALAVYLADDGTTITARGLEPSENMKLGKRSVRVLKAEKLDAGEETVLTVAGVSTPAKDQPTATNNAVPATTPRKVAGVGVLGIFVVGATMMLIRKLGPGRAAEAGSVREED